MFPDGVIAVKMSPLSARHHNAVVEDKVTITVQEY
jgi:hypothetical protein